MPTLCIIDMQTGFTAASNERCRRNVIAEIKKAKERLDPIVIVEYADSCYGNTYPEILAEVKGYQLLAKVTKYKDDGSYNVLRTCRRRKFCTDHFLVCGVNADYCVKSTAEGLAERLPKSQVEVVRKACHSSSSNGSQMFAWGKGVGNLSKV